MDLDRVKQLAGLPIAEATAMNVSQATQLARSVLIGADDLIARFVEVVGTERNHPNEHAFRELVIDNILHELRERLLKTETASYR